MDALRLPPADADGGEPLGRREAPRGALPGAAGGARHAAPGRAHQPPGRRERGLAGAPPGGVPGTIVAITHDRYFLDNVAEWILELDRGEGHPCKGNYSSLAGAEAGAAARRRRSRTSARQRTLERELEWVRMAPRARQAKSKARLQRLRAAAERGPAREAQHAARDRHPQRPAPGRRGGGRGGPHQGVRRPRCSIEELSFRLPRGGIVGVVGPNGAGKTTLFRMITGQEQPDAGS